MGGGEIDGGGGGDGGAGGSGGAGGGSGGRGGREWCGVRSASLAEEKSRPESNSRRS